MSRKRLLGWLLGVAVAGTATPTVCSAHGASASPVNASPAQAAAKQPGQESATKSSSTSQGSKPSPRQKKSRRYRRRGQLAPTAERIREVQQALAREGHYTAKPTGKWDARTIAAMKSFQQAHGLNPTGKLDARSLQLLGLGSEVAGVAPPRPAPAPNDRQ